MSEQMLEITEADAQVLKELVELAETDPEGYQALIEDLGNEDDLARAHGQFILDVLSADRHERDEQLLEVLNRAWMKAEAEGDQEGGGGEPY